MPVEARFRQSTDLLGTLEVLSDEIGKADTASTVRIYYFGDMRESMGSSHRNFDAHPPGNRQQAEQWADADTAVLGAMAIQNSRFRNAEIRVLMGNLAAKPNAPAVRAYWERLFRNADFDSTKIHFN